MAWNGSDKEKAKVEGERRSKLRSSAGGRGRPPLPADGGALGDRPLPWRGLVAGLVVVLGGGLAAWFFTGERGENGERGERGERGEIKASRIAEVAPQTQAVVERPAEEAEEEAPAEPVDFQANYPRKPGHLPLPDGTVVTFKPPAPGCTSEVYTVGGLYLCDSEGNFTKYEAPKIFDNRFENTIEALASDRMMLLSARSKDFSKEEIAKYLIAPVEIYEDDPPDIVARKTATAAMKDEIRDYIKDGGTYAEYIDQLHDKVASERSLHREAMRELVQFMAEGDIEGARECKEKMNEFLAEKGYMGLKIPEEWQKKLDGVPEEGADDDE